jgi:uncharacterized membrane protein YeaQ/YmgE (transglycosylase-associated protein family)
MGIIVWIILGLVAGMVAKMLVPGGDRHRSVVTTLLRLMLAGAVSLLLPLLVRTRRRSNRTSARSRQDVIDDERRNS